MSDTQKAVPCITNEYGHRLYGTKFQFHNMPDLMAERDELRARVAELESAVEALRTAGNRVISYGEPLTEWTVAVQEALYPGSTQRLHQQADEAEQSG